MDTLTKLAIKYKTDKWGKHNYTPYYYNLFKNKGKRKRVKKVLEIGVAEGAGLRTFRDFFTNAIIYGAEIDDKRVFTEDGIQVFKCDQTKASDLDRLMSKTGRNLDLVIDDGSHVPHHQVFTCIYLLSQLNKGCTYIIEDVADTMVYDEVKKIYPQAELIKVGKRYDDRVIIVKHK